MVMNKKKPLAPPDSEVELSPGMNEGCHIPIKVADATPVTKRVTLTGSVTFFDCMQQTEDGTRTIEEAKKLPEEKTPVTDHCN